MGRVVVVGGRASYHPCGGESGDRRVEHGAYAPWRANGAGASEAVGGPIGLVFYFCQLRQDLMLFVRITRLSSVCAGGHRQQQSLHRWGGCFLLAFCGLPPIPPSREGTLVGPYSLCCSMFRQISFSTVQCPRGQRPRRSRTARARPKASPCSSPARTQRSSSHRAPIGPGKTMSPSRGQWERYFLPCWSGQRYITAKERKGTR